jgi:solute:Na+ symporter, SSS family
MIDASPVIKIITAAYKNNNCEMESEQRRNCLNAENGNRDKKYCGIIYDMLRKTKLAEILTAIFSPLDFFVLIVFVLAVFALGFYYPHQNADTYTNYFLGGRKFGWFAVGLSIFATNISSEHFVGLAGAASVRGLAVAQFELMAVFILLFLGWVLAPKFYRSGAVTVPEFMALRFDKKTRQFVSGLSIVIYVFTKILVSLFAAGLLFTKIFGMDIYASSIIIVLITGMYCVLGGASAVMRTQVLQGVVLIAGAVALSLFGLQAVGGYHVLTQRLPADFFIMFKSVRDTDYPWTGIIFGAPIIAFWYWCTDQYIIQRLQSAKSERDAQKGSFFAALLKILPLFILVFPGFIAAVLYPECAGDSAYAALITGNILPIGIKGLVVAGLLAAVMSSLAAAFNSTATLFTNDFYKVRYPEATERKLLLVGRLVTIAVVMAAVVIVPFVALISSHVYLFLQSIQSFFAPPITAVFLFMLFSSKITSRTALLTLLIGETIGAGRIVLEIVRNFGIPLHPALLQIMRINFLHFSIILFVLCVCLILFLTYTRKPSDEQTKSATFVCEPAGASSLSAELKGSRYLRTNILYSAIIVILIVGIWSLWH